MKDLREGPDSFSDRLRHVWVKRAAVCEKIYSFCSVELYLKFKEIHKNVTSVKHVRCGLMYARVTACEDVSFCVSPLSRFSALSHMKCQINVTELYRQDRWNSWSESFTHSASCCLCVTRCEHGPPIRMFGCLEVCGSWQTVCLCLAVFLSVSSSLCSLSPPSLPLFVSQYCFSPCVYLFCLLHWWFFPHNKPIHFSDGLDPNNYFPSHRLVVCVRSEGLCRCWSRFRILCFGSVCRCVWAFGSLRFWLYQHYVGFYIPAVLMKLDPSCCAGGDSVFYKAAVSNQDQL